MTVSAEDLETRLPAQDTGARYAGSACRSWGTLAATFSLAGTVTVKKRTESRVEAPGFSPATRAPVTGGLQPRPCATAAKAAFKGPLFAGLKPGASTRDSHTNHAVTLLANGGRPSHATEVLGVRH